MEGSFGAEVVDVRDLDKDVHVVAVNPRTMFTVVMVVKVIGLVRI